METAEDFWQQGTELVEQGDFVAAIASYDRAIEIKPDDHEAWSNRGNALRILGKNEEAITSCDKALEIKPDYDSAWFNWRILAEDRLVDFGHWLKVREIFRAGLQKIVFEKEPHRHLVIWQR